MKVLLYPFNLSSRLSCDQPLNTVSRASSLKKEGAFLSSPKEIYCESSKR